MATGVIPVASAADASDLSLFFHVIRRIFFQRFTEIYLLIILYTFCVVKNSMFAAIG